MSPERFDYLLALAKPLIKKEDTNLVYSKPNKHMFLTFSFQNFIYIC